MDSVEPKEQPPSAKDERGLLGARPSSYHYFRKKSKLGFGRRWQNGQREGASYQPKSTPGTPKLPNEALQITFQLTKTIRGPSKGVGATFEKIQKIQDSQYVPFPPPRMVRL